MPGTSRLLRASVACGIGGVIAIALTLLVNDVPASLIADSVRPNEPRVFADSSGRFYAKSIPSNNSGPAGKTTIYRIGKKSDVEVLHFDWFTWSMWFQRVRSEGDYRFSVVRRGNFSRAVLTFYLDKEVLAEYSLMDIAVLPENIIRSTSSASAIGRVLGYRRVRGQEYVFELCTHDGRVMSFNAQTGDLIGDERDRSGVRCSTDRYGRR